MVKNYWLVAWRNLIKNKAHSIINIAGLSVGMAVAILIGLWMRDEWSFDKQYPHSDKIALVIQNLQDNGSTGTWKTVPYPLADELRKHYGSDFSQVVLGSLQGDHQVDYGDKKLKTVGGFFEAPFADMLNLKMLKGSRDNLKEPTTILLSASAARSYFGQVDPMGKILRFDNLFEGKVGGVYADLPFNSTFGTLGFIGNWQLIYQKTDFIRSIQDPWRPNAFQVYVQLADGSDFASASHRIKDAKLKNVNARLARFHPQLFLFPMAKWHLYAEFKNGVNIGGRIQYVWLFGIIGVFVVYLQIQFAKDRSVGFSRSGLLTVNMNTHKIHEHFDAVKKELIDDGAITDMAEGSGSPGTTYSSTSGISWPGKDPVMIADIGQLAVSWDYGKTVGWQLTEGRDFSRQFLSDSGAILMNEAAVQFMGLRHPVGQTITADKTPFRVIGVIKDIVNGSPYEQIRPLVIYLATDPDENVIVRLNPSRSAGQSLAAVSAVFRKYNPEQTFDYRFADDDFSRKFDNEQRIGRLAAVFAALAIFISCLGLFGMSAFAAEQRTREIGVRKVLGASVFNLWGLLSKDFVVLVLISLIIAIPLAWIGMHSWLANYTYHASIAWWCFALPAAGALIITLLTVSFQTVKAALTNPVRSLRSE